MFAHAWKQAGFISAQAIDPGRGDHRGRDRDSRGRRLVFGIRRPFAIGRNGNQRRKNGCRFAAAGLSV